jgi:hypothetical protein
VHQENNFRFARQAREKLISQPLFDLQIKLHLSLTHCGSITDIVVLTGSVFSKINFRVSSVSRFTVTICCTSLYVVLFNDTYTMQKVHIRHFFRLYVPLSCPPGYQLHMLTPPDNPFGFVLKDKATNRTHSYQLELFCIADDEKPSRSYENWAAWAKRNPICFQTTQNDQIEGVLIRIKVNHGVFDFRKLNEQLARIALNYYVDGILQQRAASPIIKILPKRRVASDDDEGKSILITTVNDLLTYVLRRNSIPIKYYYFH